MNLLPISSLSAAVLVLFTMAATAAQTTDEGGRHADGERILRHLSADAGQPVLEALREDYPALADGITGYALGEIWTRTGLDDRTRQLAAVSAFAAQGNLAYMKVHAGYALQHGVTREQLKEVIYLTTVTAGFPRAIDAAQALREVPDPDPAR